MAYAFGVLLMATLWTVDGTLVKDASGNLVDCADCPCGGNDCCGEALGTLYAYWGFINSATSGSFDCPCAPPYMQCLPLTYNSGSNAWIGSGNMGTCENEDESPKTIQITLDCVSGFWRVRVLFDGDSCPVLEQTLTGTHTGCPPLDFFEITLDEGCCPALVQFQDTNRLVVKILETPCAVEDCPECDLVPLFWSFDITEQTTPIGDCENFVGSYTIENILLENGGKSCAWDNYDDVVGTTGVYAMAYIDAGTFYLFLDDPISGLTLEFTQPITDNDCCSSLDSMSQVSDPCDNPGILITPVPVPSGGGCA